MARTEIRDGEGVLLAYKIAKELPEGLCAWSDEKDFVQVLSWNYGAGKCLASHIHLLAERSASHTQEAIVLLSGSLTASVFDRARRLVERVTVSEGEAMVFLEGGHGYEILEDGTRVIEVKNGPFPGAERDRERF